MTTRDDAPDSTRRLSAPPPAMPAPARDSAAPRVDDPLRSILIERLGPEAGAAVFAATQRPRVAAWPSAFVERQRQLTADLDTVSAAIGARSAELDRSVVPLRRAVDIAYDAWAAAAAVWAQSPARLAVERAEADLLAARDQLANRERRNEEALQPLRARSQRLRWELSQPDLDALGGPGFRQWGQPDWHEPNAPGVERDPPDSENTHPIHPVLHHFPSSDGP